MALLFFFFLIFHNMQLKPKKLSAGRKTPPPHPAPQAPASGQKTRRGIEGEEDPAAAGIERFFSLKGPFRAQARASANGWTFRFLESFFCFLGFISHVIQLTPQQQSAEPRNSAGAEALAVARRPFLSFCIPHLIQLIPHKLSAERNGAGAGARVNL